MDTRTQQKQPREGHYQDLELLNIAHQKYVVCIPFIEASNAVVIVYTITVVIITGIIILTMCLVTIICV